MEKIIILIGLLMLVSACVSEYKPEPRQKLIDMNCDDLIDSLKSDCPHVLINDCELYTQNILKMIELRGCSSLISTES